MFIGSPAWIGMLVLARFHWPCRSAGPIYPSGCGHRAFHLRLVMWFSPKLASASIFCSDRSFVAISADRGRLLVNFAIETVYSILLCPIFWFGHTIFLAGLLFGREIGWIGQIRDDHAVPFTSRSESLAAHAAWICHAWHVGGDASGRNSLYVVSGGGACSGDPVRDDHCLALSWSSVGPYRPWAIARRNIASARAACPGAARDRDGHAVSTAKFGLTRCSSH